MNLIPLKNISIKIKILLLMIISVVAILLTSTYFTRKMIEKDAEANLQQDTSNVVREIDSAVTTDQSLTDLEVINEDLMDMMAIRTNIERIDLFSFSPDGKLLPLTSKVTAKVTAPHSQMVLSTDDLERVKKGQILSKAEQIGKVNYMNVIAPVHLNGNVFGLIEMKISLKEFDRLLHKERSQAFIIAILSVLLISGLFAVSMTRMIHRPIQNLLMAMSMVKAGDLTVSIVPRAQDELGKLTGSFNSMIQMIRQSVEANQVLLARIHSFNEELQEEIHRATEELQKRNDDLTRANRAIFQMQKQLVLSRELAAIGQLAATVAHELGTPLHSVSGHLQLLLTEGGLTEEARRRLSIMQSQVERLINSIQQLLNTTRPNNADFGWIDLNQVLEDLCVLFLPATISKQIIVVKEFDPDLPKIPGSHSQVQEVFLNLIDNAIDELPIGGTLTLRTSRTGPLQDSIRPPWTDLSDSDWVQVTIQDNSHGIPTDHLQKIFEPFFTTKGPGQGTGLGLPISQDIVRRHGGTITVESKLNEGSRFVVQLPLKKRG
ncbi:MAG: HAMP domain-containing protein [Nitrospirae bacterium]|nr:HAMP domain-containing protein [Nitrospirota bacterium]